MMTSKKNPIFKKLLDEGISSVAKRQDKQLKAVEWDMAEGLGYTSASMVQHWRRGHIPAKPAQVESIVRYCVQKGRVGRAWAQSMLYHALYPDPMMLLADMFPFASGQRFRLFLSYQRGVEPDESIALKVAQALNDPHIVFFDQAKVINQQWVKRLQEELSQAHCVIFLLSAHAIHSEIVLQQLDMVQKVREQHAIGVGSTIRVLPVWLAYQSGFAQARHAALKGLKWAIWQHKDDTSRLIEELKQAVVGGNLPLTATEVGERSQSSRLPSLQPPTPSVGHLELQDGALPPNDPFYVEREADERACRAIAQQGVTITIKGARQMGKSSLLLRLGRAAQQIGKRVVWLDCDLLKVSSSDAESFFHHFCDELTDELGLENRLAEQKRPITHALRCTKYVRREILSRLEQPCVVALDGAESLFDTPYRDAFFGMLRIWHNNRAAKVIWRKLDLVVITSTEPYYFIQNLQQSPFNVGTIIELQEFTPQQVSDLNRRYGHPLKPKEEKTLISLVQGHPYLVRRAFYLIASKQYNQNELFAHAINDRGPFGDHLRALLWLLHTHDKSLRTGLRDVIRHNRCDEALFFRLRGAGLVRREQGAIVARCPLYANFFLEHLNE